MSIVEKAMPKMSPRYLARSPNSILSATPFIQASQRAEAARPASRCAQGAAPGGPCDIRSVPAARAGRPDAERGREMELSGLAGHGLAAFCAGTVSCARA